MAISIKEKPVLKKKPYGWAIHTTFSQNKHGADKEEAWQVATSSSLPPLHFLVLFSCRG